LEAAQLKTKARAEREVAQRAKADFLIGQAGGGSWQSKLLLLSAVCRCRLICG